LVKLLIDKNGANIERFQ